MQAFLYVEKCLEVGSAHAAAAVRIPHVVPPADYAECGYYGSGDLRFSWADCLMWACTKGGFEGVVGPSMNFFL